MHSMLFFSFAAALFFTACSKAPSPQIESHAAKAVSSELQIVKSENQLTGFYDKLKAFDLDMDIGKFYNITPDFISEQSAYAIFKDDKSCMSFIMYEGELYETGPYFGGFGITGMALADLDKDNRDELYYTFSSGSGMHRSHIGYFNPAAKEIMLFEYTYLDHDMMLTTTESGDLCVNEAAVTGESFVDFTVNAGKEIGRIFLKDNSITIDMAGQDDSRLQ